MELLSVVLLMMFGALVYLERRLHVVEERTVAIAAKLDLLLDSMDGPKNAPNPETDVGPAP